MILKKAPKFSLEFGDVTDRRRSSREIRYLAISAGPVAGVIGIKVDADGEALRAPGPDGINVGEARAISAVIIDVQLGHARSRCSGLSGRNPWDILIACDLHQAVM